MTYTHTHIVSISMIFPDDSFINSLYTVFFSSLKTFIIASSKSLFAKYNKWTISEAVSTDCFSSPSEWITPSCFFARLVIFG